MLYNDQAERAILGCILVEQSLFPHVLAIIKSQDYFYYEKHRILWVLFEKLISRDIIIDEVTVTQQIYEDNLRDSIEISYLTSLSNETPTTSNWKAYAEIVAEKWKARKLTKECAKAIDSLQSEKKSYDCWISVSDKISTIFSGIEKRFEINDLLNELEEIEKGIRPWGMKWNFSVLDNRIGDFQPGTIHIIAGRPGNGKTSLAIHLAENWTDRRIPLLYESLEMQEKDLAYRRISRLSKIPISDFKAGRITNRWESIHHASAIIFDKRDKFIVNDKKYKTPDDIAMDIKIAFDLYGIQIFILDHWHRIIFPHTGDNHLHRAEDGFEKIVGTCTNLGITPIILAQLNREGEKREHREEMPIPADIRDIARLHEAADTLIFTHWPYRQTNGNADKNSLWIRVSKCRDGNTGDDQTFYEPEICSINGGV